MRSAFQINISKYFRGQIKNSTKLNDAKSWVYTESLWRNFYIQKWMCELLENSFGKFLKSNPVEERDLLLHISGDMKTIGFKKNMPEFVTLIKNYLFLFRANLNHFTLIRATKSAKLERTKNKQKRRRGITFQNRVKKLLKNIK